MSFDNITINGHSSTRVEAGSKVIYFDPWKLSGTPRDADCIFITHDHFDHFSPEDIDRIANADTLIVAPLSTKEKVESEIAPKLKANLRFVNAGEDFTIEGISVHPIASYNVGKDFHKKEYGWLGYVVEADAVKYYVTGDMDENEDALKVKCDVAFVPIGGTYTMTAKEAAAFVNKIKPKTVIPFHYGDIVGSDKDAKEFAGLVDKGIDVVLKI